MGCSRLENNWEREDYSDEFTDSIIVVWGAAKPVWSFRPSLMTRSEGDLTHRVALKRAAIRFYIHGNQQIPDSPCSPSLGLLFVFPGAFPAPGAGQLGTGIVNLSSVDGQISCVGEVFYVYASAFFFAVF